MRGYVHSTAQNYIRKYPSRDPFAILEDLGVIVRFSSGYKSTLGYTQYILRTYFVVINDALPEEIKRIVAAHELGHVLLHKDKLRQGAIAPCNLAVCTDQMEYEANLFAAELLLTDDAFLPGSGGDAETLSYICAKQNLPAELVMYKIRALQDRGFLLEFNSSCESGCMKRLRPYLEYVRENCW